MNTNRLRNLVVLLVCLVMSAGYALADNHDRDRRESREQYMREARERREHRMQEARERRERWQHERRERLEANRQHIERERWERARREREYRDRMSDRRPSGWDKGRKTGWGDRSLPPGQAKKMGYTHRDYDGWRGTRYRQAAWYR